MTATVPRTLSPPALKELRITLPLPRRELSPNGRFHWAKKARAVREYRNRAWAEASRSLLYGKRPRWVNAEVRVTWYLPDLRRRDPDNLQASLKAAYDGLRDAGILADDQGLTIHAPRLLLDCKMPRVELQITEVAA